MSSNKEVLRNLDRLHLTRAKVMCYTLTEPAKRIERRDSLFRTSFQ